MNSRFNCKPLYSLIALTSIFASMGSAHAAYTTQSFDDTQIKDAFASYDMEDGNIASVTFNNEDNTYAIKYFDGETFATIVESETIKTDVGLSNGVIFWTEDSFTPPIDTVEKALFQYKDGVITQITNDQFPKEGFTYNNGQAAWFQKESSNSAPFGNKNVYVYNGETIIQVSDDADTVSKFDNNRRSIQMHNNEVVYVARGAAYYWDGLSVNKISSDDVIVNLADIENGVIVYEGREQATNEESVYKYQAGQTSIIGDDNNDDLFLSITDPQIEDGIISWEVLTDFTGQNSELYIIEDNQTVMLSSKLQNGRASVDNGKIVWMEGTSGTPHTIFEYQNGITTQVHAGANTVVIEADGGHIFWRERTNSSQHYYTLATPVINTNTLNLGEEFNKTAFTLDGETSVEITEFSDWSWQPTYLEFGIKAAEGESLDGIVALNQAGKEFALSSTWQRIPVTFSNELSSLTLKSTSAINLSLEWWATTEPNGINLGEEHSFTYIDSNKATTLIVDQWSTWGWTPKQVGFGITAEDGRELEGLKVIASDGTNYSLEGWWDSFNRPFNWQPVKVVIPEQNQVLKVEWWANAD